MDTRSPGSYLKHTSPDFSGLSFAPHKSLHSSTLPPRTWLHVAIFSQPHTGYKLFLSKISQFIFTFPVDTLQQFSRMTHKPREKPKANQTGITAMTKTICTTIAKATILDWNRERNTVYGNPVYSFTLTDETGKLYRGKTRPNAGFVYGLNYHPSELANVVIAITPSDRVYMDDAENVK